jgi:hypothetical protein
MKLGPCLESTSRRCGHGIPTDGGPEAGSSNEECPIGTFCARLLPAGATDASECPLEVPGTCWGLPAVCPELHAGSDRWLPCPPAKGACATTCDAIRTGMPHKRAKACP